jgi:hypothetical protein
MHKRAPAVCVICKLCKNKELKSSSAIPLPARLLPLTTVESTD